MVNEIVPPSYWWVNRGKSMKTIELTHVSRMNADYRGELKIIMINHGDQPFPVRRGERIAQLVPAAVTQAEWEEVDKLDETVRGEGGFGSTGR